MRNKAKRKLTIEEGVLMVLGLGTFAAFLLLDLVLVIVWLVS